MARDCAKCAMEMERNLVSGSFFTSDIPNKEVITLFFDVDRILVSNVNQRRVRVQPNNPIDVFLDDFLYWIKQGIRGVRFVYPDQEQNFLINHPEIKPFRYA